MTHDDAVDGPGRVYGRDLKIGDKYPLGSHTISEQEIIDFAGSWDPQDFHIDKAAAEAGAYDGLIASGIHTIAVYQRLAVEHVFCNWRIIAGRSLRDLHFLRPVRPGDTLTGTVVIEDVRFDDGNRALVSSSAELVNQKGKPVLSLVLDSYIRDRPA